MKKMTKRPLRLQTETVRVVQDDRLASVVGGLVDPISSSSSASYQSSRGINCAP